MIVFTLPISGGSFPTQISALCELIDIGCKHDTIFACSGGNIAAYVGSAGNWKRDRVEDVVKKIHSGLMIESWAPGPLMYVWAYFSGSLYRSGDGIQRFFRHYFTEETVCKDEIWTSTYDRTNQKAAYYCNLDQPRSFTPSLKVTLLQCHPPKFMSGDIERISVVSQASASIPTYVESQHIDEGEHCDGGVCGASPLGVFRSSLPKKNLHVFYINGMDVEKQDGKCLYYNIFGNGILAMSEVTRNKILQDRMFGVEGVPVHQSTPYRKNFDIRYISNVVSRLDEIVNSLIEIYPETYLELDITNFDGADILKMMYDVKLLCRIWWEGPHDIFDDIPNVTSSSIQNSS